MLMKKDVVEGDECPGPEVLYQSERWSLRGPLRWRANRGSPELLPSSLAV